MADGYVGMFKVPDFGAIVPRTNNVSAMTMTVTEDFIEGKRAVGSRAAGCTCTGSGGSTTTAACSDMTMDWAATSTGRTMRTASTLG